MRLIAEEINNVDFLCEEKEGKSNSLAKDHVDSECSEKTAPLLQPSNFKTNQDTLVKAKTHQLQKDF